MVHAEAQKRPQPEFVTEISTVLSGQVGPHNELSP